MGILFSSLLAKNTSQVFNQTAHLSSICFDNSTCNWFSISNSHFILNNCFFGYCPQSDVSKLPKVISGHCKGINTG